MRHAPLAVLAALMLSACAGDYYGPFNGGDMAYYDGFYGPYYDGYWGNEGMFYHRADRDHPYVRDEGQHFRHGPAHGFHGVHVGHGGGGRH